MLNNGGSHSEYFEELCALAAGGQISEPEFVELSDHMRFCDRCRSAYEDFTDLVHNRLPLADPELTGSSHPAGLPFENSAYRERFVTRARKAGLAVSHGALGGTSQSRSGSGWSPRLSYAHAAIALLAVAAGILGYAWLQSNTRYTKLTAELAAIRDEIRNQERPEYRPPQESQPESRPALDAVHEPPVAFAAIASDLSHVRGEYADVAARANELQEQLNAATLALEDSRGQSGELRDSRSKLTIQLADAERVIAQVKEELQSARESRSRDSSEITLQATRIRYLSEKLSAQTEILDRETTLLAEAREIHDLMGARNLHIVEVQDNDSKGKDRKPFGRVFYTEGKSLTFYAFDLDGRAPKKRDASFQVWGTREGLRTVPRNLGILQMDDQKQNLWVLKFENPAILAEIDSVFVTVEPSDARSPRPSSDKFLYAYLKAEPNNP